MDIPVFLQFIILFPQMEIYPEQKGDDQDKKVKANHCAWKDIEAVPEYHPEQNQEQIKQK